VVHQNEHEAPNHDASKKTSAEAIDTPGNWMYAAKLAGEGGKMYDVCHALKDSLLALGAGTLVAERTHSMAAQCGDEVVKPPKTRRGTIFSPSSQSTKKRRTRVVPITVLFSPLKQYGKAARVMYTSRSHTGVYPPWRLT